MDASTTPISENRPLSPEEEALARWMLTHGRPAAHAFLPQLARARVVSRCPCGCASVDFAVEGEPAPSGGLRVLGDFAYGDAAHLNGAFIFERGDVLAGIEVYSLAGEDAPPELPEPATLRPFERAG
jgi:hypothetical protein